MTCLAGQPSCSLDDPVANLQTHELENGLVLLTLEDHSTPVVSVQLWVKVGSKDESVYTGIAHLFEHMMFKGTPTIGTSDAKRDAEIIE